MRYVLGVEGGQSATTAVVTDETGCVLGVGQSGAIRANGETWDAVRAKKMLTDSIHAAMRMAELENVRVAATCLGFANDQVHGDVQLKAVSYYDFLQSTCESIVPTSHVIFETSPRLALYAVTFGRPGVVVRAGSGSVAYGLNAQGEQAQCGGWGRLLGDEGSGYWIARRALNACCRAYDGIEPPTLLESLLLKHLEMTDLPQLQKAFLTETIRPGDIVGLAEIVSRAAGLGDKTARRILREAGKELASSAQAVLSRLRMEQEPIVVGTVGGVFRAGRAILRTFREKVKQAAPNAIITSPRVSPAVGAAVIALEAIEVPLGDELLTNLQNHMPRLSVVKS